jgi:anhydro-N-acetylmuramic acid kinase
VSNLTFYDGGDSLVGFDAGPGNALMDDYMRRHRDAEFDGGGALAASGTADEALVDQWMRHAYFDRRWPKSLDRQAFHACLDSPRLKGLSAADAMASLALFTGRSIAHAIDRLPDAPRHVMLAGGGRHNACLYGILRRLIGSALGPADADYSAFSSDMLEAELMAFLAARHCAGLPTSFPATTGCRQPVRGGRLVRAG